jgi:hypothetical protein
MNHIDSLSIPIDGELRHDFIVDCARFAEGILTEKAVKKKYLFDAETWERLGSDEALIEAIEVEKTRRIRNGTTARERAQVLYAETPTVLGNILHDGGASPRHRIESARELRQIADNGPQQSVPAAAADRFLITINLGNGEVLRYPNDNDQSKISKDASPKWIDVNPNDDSSTAPVERLPVPATKKGDDGSGESI